MTAMKPYLSHHRKFDAHPMPKFVDPPVKLFMGIDKYENEHLIKWGWPEDVWFHVDKVSSAHVYLRLNPGQTLDDIDLKVIEDAAQLCKANSIQGNKMNNVDIVYTRWSNLKKIESMDVGQVGFYNENEVKKIRISQRKNEVINRLNKTKVSQTPDLQGERMARDKKESEMTKKTLKLKKEQERQEIENKRQDVELRSYERLFSSDKMKTNKDAADEDSDDFM